MIQDRGMFGFGSNVQFDMHMKGGAMLYESYITIVTYLSVLDCSVIEHQVLFSQNKNILMHLCH